MKRIWSWIVDAFGQLGAVLYVLAMVGVLLALLYGRL